MDLMKDNNGKQIVLSGEHYEKSVAILTELSHRTRARAALLADMSGQLICQRGDVDHGSMPTLAALSAGDFAATAEMAKLIGEAQRFKFLFHEGEHENVYLSNVGENFLLVVVFDSSVAIGMVRVYTNKAIAQLSKIIDTIVQEDQKAADVLDSEFQALLSKELDNSFGF